MSWPNLVLVLATGCGRFGFTDLPPEDARLGDATIDATDARMTIGHDEDGDSFGDGEDNCPHLPNLDQLNGDGDQVGDVCDPEPAIARQTLAVFLAMTEQRTDITNTRWTQGVDVWTSNAAVSSYFGLPFTATTVDIWFALDVTALDTGAGVYQFTLNPSLPTVSPRYYVELYENSSTKIAAITSYDDVVFDGIHVENLPTGLHTGLITVHARFDGAARTITTELGWPGERYSLAGPAPAFTGTTELRFRVDGIASALHYFAVVETAP